MYGIGIFEIFIVFLVLLLFFKPRDIFRLFRKAGAWYSQFRDFEKKIREDIDFTGSSESEPTKTGKQNEEK
jgi:Sec-independent protein translocase protein TatA